jgi:hypothetical protein
MPRQITAIGVKAPISASVSVMPPTATKERKQSTVPQQALALQTRIAALATLMAVLGAQILLEIPLAILNANSDSR